ncbi:curved DNA-binding protein CbpA [Catalinimonas alkaloidigena]|uniref:J domain-containing protein n=1 Tax=Catalinimonas alkaloidigena TaxID=1075417 RepID=UPI002405EB8C|nr:DnaJ domain-containing protein [Catalinimonas alkaloidigena]MDF9797646.1 curved DNA-binding protein CbpA [Catalinimonas alkaloidigena]
MERYYQILEIPVGSSQHEIKKAYRKLAMRFHPDKNDGKDIGQRFIQITEAYEILIGVRKAPASRIFSPQYQQHAYNRRPYNFRRQSYREMWEEERLRRKRDARRNAKEHAKRRYENFKKNNEAFKKSWYYKPTYYLIHTIQVLGWTFGLFLLLSPLFAALYFHFNDSQWWKCLVCLPLILAGILCIEHTKRLMREAEPFFS